MLVIGRSDVYFPKIRIDEVTTSMETDLTCLTIREKSWPQRKGAHGSFMSRHAFVHLVERSPYHHPDEP